MKVENMPDTKMKSSVGHERIIIFALCIIAALRIFLFSAAFPFFNNVDEGAHFDLVYKYSQGYLPHLGKEHFSREFVELIALYGSPQYLSNKQDLPDISKLKPLWKYPGVQGSEHLNKVISEWQQQYTNHEVGSFPVYYSIAGFWYTIGQRLGIEGASLLYWVRFLNIPLFAALVYVCYLIGQIFFPDNLLQRIGLPLIVAFFPQDVFYSVNNDTMSPLLFAIALFLLLQIYFRDKSFGYHILAGLVIAATFLVKPSNIAVLVLLIVVIALKTIQFYHKKEIIVYLPRLIGLLAAAITPIGILLVWNSIVIGDMFAADDKVAALGWTVKSLGQLWNHPIFTPGGLFYFLTELTKSFWRGEFVWYSERIASYGMDLFYVISSAVFVLASGLGLLLSKDKTKAQHRFILGVSFLTLITSVGLLAFLSTLYDFGNSWYPSRQEPYFVSGRLISCVLVPFLFIYLDGLGRIFSVVKKRVNPLVIVVLIAIVATLSELLLTLDVFRSPYNWFHIR